MPIGKNILVTRGLGTNSALVTKGYAQTPPALLAGYGYPQAKAGKIYVKITANEDLLQSPTFSIGHQGSVEVTDQPTTSFNNSANIFIGEYTVHDRQESGYEDGLALVTVSGIDAITNNVSEDVEPTIGKNFNIDTIAPVIDLAYSKDRLHLGDGAVVITSVFDEDIDDYWGDPLLTLRKADGTAFESGVMIKSGADTYYYTFTVTGGMTHEHLTVEISDAFDYAGNECDFPTEEQVIVIDRRGPKFCEINVTPEILSTVSGYDLAIITFRSNEPCQTGTVTCTVDGNSASLISKSANNTLWQFEYTVLGSETEGARPIAIQGTDLAGNVDTGSASVIFDFTDPAVVIDSPVTAGADLNGGINDSVLTLDYDTETGTLPSEGLILIDSELIAYTGKSGGSLTGLTRGYNGTTAASHSDGVTFQFVNIWPNDDVEFSWSDTNKVDPDKSTVTVNSQDVTADSIIHESGGEYETP